MLEYDYDTLLYLSFLTAAETLTKDVGTQYNPTDCVLGPVSAHSVQNIATNDSASSDSENSDHLDCNKVHSSDYTATSNDDDIDITVSDTEDMCTSPVDQQKFIMFSNKLDELFHFSSKCGSQVTHTNNGVLMVVPG